MKTITLVAIGIGAVGALAAAPGIANAAAVSAPAPAPAPVVSTEVGTISNVTATVVKHPQYGTVYKISGTITGAAKGQTVALLTAAGTPAKGFKTFPFGGGTAFTMYYNPGAAGGDYIAQIGTQRSTPFYLNPIASLQNGLNAATAIGGR